MKNISILRLYRNKIILTVVDILIIIGASVLSYMLFADSYKIESIPLRKIINTVILSIIVYQIFFRAFKVYKNITRFENGEDYLVYILASSLSIALIIEIRLITQINVLTIKECITMYLIIMIGTISYRVIIRMMLFMGKENLLNGEKCKKILIIGGGNAAREIIKNIKTTLNKKYSVVGIIDDNPLKWNCYISGIEVLGGRDKILKACKNHDVDEIFFTITEINKQEKSAILEICSNAKIPTKILPSTAELIEKNNLLANLKNIEIEDLLGRESIKLDNTNIENEIKDKVVLVTGGGGSIGSELCRQIIKYKPKQLIIFDIYENNLYDIEIELKSKYKSSNIVAIVGSVRDKRKVEKIFKEYNPYLVFHAAAHKHVPLMENSPLEAIKNNVIGTKNVADSADKYKTKKFVLISTDKAVNPTNIMGATKRTCEMIIQAKAQKSKTEFSAVRFGNVLGSNGSVVPLFKKQIESGGPVTVTHKEITRFFMTIPEAIELILQAMTYAKGGEIFVLDMGNPVKIYDLAISLIKLSGLRPNIDIPIKITGLRPGEKLYEELLMSEEGLQKTEHNKIFVAKPLDISDEEVKSRIEILEKFCEDEEHDIEEIKKTIKYVVPNFIEPELVNNIKSEESVSDNNVVNRELVNC